MLRDLEAASRLMTVRDVVLYERDALDTLDDPRLRAVLNLMDRLEEEIAATIATLDPLSHQN